MDSTWYLIQLPVHSYSSTGCFHEPKIMCYSPHIPCPHRVQHCVFIRWHMEENCLVDLESITIGHWYLWRTLTHAKWCQWGVNVTAGALSWLMYDRTRDILEVNDARKPILAHKSKALDNIPPTQSALHQHIKRPSLQANCWNQTLVLNPELPSPSDWGWIKEASG